MNEPPPKRPETDRRFRQAERLGRLLTMFRLVSGRGHWNPESLAVELDCSVRTVYRLRDTLELSGVPITFDKSQNSYRLRFPCRAPVLPPTDEDVHQMVTGQTLIRDLFRDVAKPGDLSLLPLSEEQFEQAAVLRSLMTARSPLAGDTTRTDDRIRIVQTALARSRRLVGTYRSPREEADIAIELHPRRLCWISGVWYVIGRDTTQSEPRTYRVERFKQINFSDTESEADCDFDIGDYFQHAWSVYRGAPVQTIRVRFDPPAATIVGATQWHPTQSKDEHPDGSVTLVWQVAGLEEFLRWLMPWVSQATVLEPDELKVRVFEECERAIQRNARWEAGS